MAPTSTSAAVAVVESVFTEPERLALAGFLAGYTGLTREAYALDLRQFTSWCQQRHIRLFQVRRADIECFARDWSPTSVPGPPARRLCTVAGFYRYAVEEEFLDHSPAAHVRRPRLDYESHATGLDRNELGALLVAAGLGTPAEHALISLLALNGLRVSEVTGADIEALGVERGHRTWWSPAKRAAKSSPCRSRRALPGRSTWRSVSVARDRSSWPPMVAGWTGMVLGGSSAGSPAAPGSSSRSGRIRCGMRSSLPRWMLGARCGPCRKLPRTPIPGPPCGMTAPVAVSTGTPPTSSPPMSPVPPGKN